jgi:hypothetical protein
MSIASLSWRDVAPSGWVVSGTGRVSVLSPPDNGQQHPGQVDDGREYHESDRQPNDHACDPTN